MTSTALMIKCARLVVVCFVVAIEMLSTQATSCLASASDDMLQRIRLGETVAQMQSDLGPPRRFRINEIFQFWVYDGTDRDTWRVAIVQHSHIVTIYVRPKLGHKTLIGDGHGIVLGGSVKQLNWIHPSSQAAQIHFSIRKASQGVYRLYEVNDGLITGIGITREDFRSLPFAVTYERSDGFSVSEALRVKHTQLPKAEASFLKQPCDRSGHWEVVDRRAVFVKGRHFEKMVLRCSRSKYMRPVYFEVMK